MAAAQDVLETRLELLGLGAYQSDLSRAATALGIFGSELDAVGRKQFAAFTIAGTIAAGTIGLLGKAAVAAGEEDAAFARAAVTFKSYGNAFPQSEIEQLSSQLQDLTGVADDSIASFIGLLGSFNLTAKQAREFALPILDAAEALKAQGVTTESLAVQIGKALQTGNVSALRRVGIIVDENRAKTDVYGAVLEAVTRQGQGAAVVFRQSLPGALQATKNAWADVEEATGRAILPAILPLVNAAESFARAIRDTPGAATVLAGAMVGIAGASAVAAFNTGRMVINLTRAKVEAAQVAAALTVGAGSTAFMGGLGKGGAGAAAGAAGAVGSAGLLAKLGTVGKVAAVALIAYEAFQLYSSWVGSQQGGKGAPGTGGSGRSVQEEQLEQLRKIAQNTDKLGGKEIRKELGDAALIRYFSRQVR